MSIDPGDIRRWRRLIVAGGLLLAFLQLFRAFHGAQTRFVANDGDWYYAYAASLYFDRDIDLSNQMAVWRTTVGEPVLPIAPGRPTPTAFTVGPALLWLPAMALADLGVLVAREWGSTIDRSGYTTPYQLAVALATLLYGLIGVWLALGAAVWWMGSEEARWQPAAPLAALGALCASPAIYYIFFEPTMAHGLSVFAASLLVWLWLRTGLSVHWGRWATVGFAGGLCALIRPQDCLLLLLPLSTIAFAQPRRLGSRLLPLLGGACLAFLPQMAVWWLTFGRPIAVPQGSEFMQWTRPALLQVWLSPRHGLFTWTPVWLIALLGLIRGPQASRQALVLMLVVFLLESYVNAAARDWWGGDAFGARRFLSLFPIFVLGLASIASRFGRRSVYSFMAMGMTAVTMNFVLMIAYVTDLIPHG